MNLTSSEDLRKYYDLEGKLPTAPRQGEGRGGGGMPTAPLEGGGGGCDLTVGAFCSCADDSGKVPRGEKRKEKKKGSNVANGPDVDEPVLGKAPASDESDGEAPRLIAAEGGAPVSSVQDELEESDVSSEEDGEEDGGRSEDDQSSSTDVETLGAEQLEEAVSTSANV